MIPFRLSFVRTAAVLLLLGSACGDDAGEPQDACSAMPDPSLVLGQGVGGAFEELVDGQEVGLVVAPQGGSGVSVLIRTRGFEASNEARVDALLDVERSGLNAGSFLLEGAPLLCDSAERGGTISGVVIGFDPDQFSSNDDLLMLNGEVVDLIVTITDADGRSATVRTPVTVRAGG